nr:proteinase inhibitor PSI-1.2-like [Ipomoea batatas]
MATTKLSFVTLLLLCGIVMVVNHANAQQMKPCTLECDGRAEYMVCPYGQGSKMKQFQVAGSLCMNCCGAENLGCILFDQSGTPYCHQDRSLRTERDWGGVWGGTPALIALHLDLPCFVLTLVDLLGSGGGDASVSTGSLFCTGVTAGISSKSGRASWLGMEANARHPNTLRY